MIERAFYWYVADKQPKATWQYTESFGIHKKEEEESESKEKKKTVEPWAFGIHSFLPCPSSLLPK